MRQRQISRIAQKVIIKLAKKDSMDKMLEKIMWRKYKQLADYSLSEVAQEAMEIALYGDKEEIEENIEKLDKKNPLKAYFLEEFYKVKKKLLP